MAFYSDTHTAGTAKPSRIAAIFDTISLKLRQRRAYRQTFNELCTLHDRDLADLGLSRGDFRRISREAAEAVS
ncbi:DUF1127 domain-containing protein [Sulfitobacter sp. HNIBRBA3233]|uniref:DUF1127 domain-containing protein n=1 Tax=Sulfitobacter marinivivus TaxID=3158558 RepID=UPI0032DE83C1